MISLSNIQQNLTCADLRYSPRLTIRYWCPAEWISNHILTDIPQIPSVICWSTEKYHLQEKIISENLCLKHCKIFYNCKHLIKNSIVKICVSNTARFSTLTSNSEIRRFYNCSASTNFIKTSTTFCKYPWKSKWTRNYSNFVELKEVLPNYHSNF